MPQELKEGVQEVQDFFTIDLSDEELIRMIDRKISNAYTVYSELKKEGLVNERYWARNQLEGIQTYWHNSRIVQNRIYLSVETMVPIITSKPAEPVVSIVDDDEEDSEKSKELTGKIQKVLLAKYYDEDKPQQEVFETVARHLLLYKLGVLKIIWDNVSDDYSVEFVHPHKLIVSPDGHYNEDVWVAQYMEWTLKEIFDQFPEKKEAIMADIFPGSAEAPDTMMGTPVGFWEYWSEDGKYIVWKMQNVILQKKLNPYIKWLDDKEFDKPNNHFRNVKKPFMFLNSQNLGTHIWDDTTPVSQGLSLQDGINMMQRIITDTSRDQGILVGAQEMIDRAELAKYTGAFNEKLIVKGGDPTRALYRVPAKSLQPFVQENLLHLENALDNVMGTHATTRGERSQQPTLGQDRMSKESDSGRLDAIVRGIERLASELYNWEVQMICVKYKKEHFIRVLGKKNGTKLADKMKDAVLRGIKVVVKPGSTLPTDKLSQRQEALELAKSNKISDIDLFKRMDFPNAVEMAKNLYLQNTDPIKLFPDLVEELEKQNKADAEEQGRLRKDGTIEPEVSMPAGQVPPPVMPGMMQQPMQQQMPSQQQQQMQQPPIQPMQQPNQPVQPQVQSEPVAPQPQVGTEHTQRLLQGEQVPPFDGIEPSEEHVSMELQFMATDEFAQLPEEIQAIYAQHVLAEREMLQGPQSDIQE